MLDRSCEALAVRQFETEKPEAPPAHPTICRSFLIGANVANIVGERGVPLFSPKLLEVSFDLINLTSPSEASAFYSTGGIIFSTFPAASITPKSIRSSAHAE